LFTALAQLHVCGVEVDWSALYRPWAPRPVGLPTYAFQRRRYWPESATSVERAEPGPRPAEPVDEQPVDFASCPAPERRQRLTDLVLRHAAVVLGHPDAAAVDLDRGFLEQGFDSLTALELRDGLQRAVGLELSATLLFRPPDADPAGRPAGHHGRRRRRRAAGRFGAGSSARCSTAPARSADRPTTRG